MNAKYLIPILITLMTFVSCKKELEPQDSSSTPVDSTVVAAAPAAPATPVNPVQVQPQMPQNPQMQQGQQMTVTPPSPQPAKVAKGMNPAHGQPGHRCDIAVGAPLNSPPVAKSTMTTQAATQNQPVTITPTQTPAPAAAPAILNSPATTTTAPGMNPPHGQAGHRCDVAVGAPLPKS